MNSSIVTLKLVLDELEVPPSIDTLSERKSVQKVVELVQGAGVDLGYTFGWYVKGPYSPGLTRDYFALDESLRSKEQFPEHRLRPLVRERLDLVKPLLTIPLEVKVEQPEWLELLASLHYLQCDRKLSADDADAVINREKAPLAPYVGFAREALEDAGLLR